MNTSSDTGGDPSASTADRAESDRRETVERYEETPIGVVVPVYNEAGFVGDVIEAVPDFVDRLYVVDDCSTDGTWDEILAHAPQSADALTVAPDDGELGPASRGRTDGGTGVAMPDDTGTGRTLVPVRHRENRGRGAAVKTGYRLAVSEGMEVVAVIDGDGQMDPTILDRIVDPVLTGEADYAKGDRLVGRDYWTEMSRWRLFGNVVLTLMTRVASGYWGMSDPQNGYTAVSADTLLDISHDSLYEDYGFLNDMLVRLNAHGKRVVDVPMRAVYADEESGIQYRSFVPQLSVLLARMFLWRLWVTYGLGEPTPRSSRTAE